jgi:ribonuclease P protein component
MLPASRRVRTAAEHREVARRGLRGRSGPLSVRIVVPAGFSTAPARAGVVVPTAVGGAVERNVVKRRLRPLLAERLPALPAGSRLVVRADGPDAVVPSSQLDAHLGRALDGALARRPRSAAR